MGGVGYWNTESGSESDWQDLGDTALGSGPDFLLGPDNVVPGPNLYTRPAGSSMTSSRRFHGSSALGIHHSAIRCLLR